VEQEWYDERPCPYCFYVALKSQRINWNQKYPSPCCHNGLYLDPNSGFPQLNVLPPVLKELCLTRGDHFGKFSAKYNKILCIGSTGVENSHNGGFEQIAGDHAVKMNGRSYHFLSKDITMLMLVLIVTMMMIMLMMKTTMMTRIIMMMKMMMKMKMTMMMKMMMMMMMMMMMVIIIIIVIFIIILITFLHNVISRYGRRWRIIERCER